jgi:hypothetical protein
MIGQLNRYDLPTLHRLQIYNDCWFHVTRRGGFFGVHNHPNASWSGVYCVDPGRHDPDQKDSGCLSFINPMITSAMHMDAGISNMQLPYGFADRQCRTRGRTARHFPILGAARRQALRGEGERITIAFNCWFTLPDAPRTRCNLLFLDRTRGQSKLLPRIASGR